MFVFAFHSVSPTLGQKSDWDYTISPSGLQQMIRTLRWLGFKIVSLRTILDTPEHQDVFRQVALTFDDGFENFYQYARPVFQQEKAPATVFVMPGRLSGYNTWDKGHLPVEEQDKLLSLPQIQELSNNPLFTFGSHGFTHQRFSTMPYEKQKKEIFESYDFLSREIPSSFLPVMAYPFGDFNTDTLNIMSVSPYSYAYTTQYGSWNQQVPRFLIPRLNIDFGDRHLSTFLMKFGKLLLRAPAKRINFPEDFRQPEFLPA